MADRQVTASRKDRDGDITALCNSAQPWSPRSKTDAINDIQRGLHTYFVQQPGTSRTNIIVVPINGRYHLKTTADGQSRNNLDNLPNC